MQKILILLCLAALTLACSLPFTINFATETPSSGSQDDGIDPVIEDPVQEENSTAHSELDTEIAAQMDIIESQVVSIRGLQPTGSVPRAVLTTEQLRDVVINDFFSDYTAEEAEADAIELAAIGLLEPGFDIYQLYIDLYAEQIAGYYDDESGELYVIQSEGFSGLQRMTHSHEYTHVLQDQTYDLRDGMNINEDNCKLDTEYCAAVTALIEGDATLTEQFWYLQYATREDQQQVNDFYNSYESPVYDAAPYFMQQDFLFPYSQGFEFVYGLYQQGGWQAVDEAYRNPPISTEQILHPERYPNDRPIPVEMDDLTNILGEGWREETRNVMGEWYSYLILSAGAEESARIPEEQARLAAEGWAGDTYLLYLNEDNSQYAFVQISQWESIDDNNEFWQALVEYATARWGTPDLFSIDRVEWENTADGVISLSRSRQLTITWIIAPDATAADALLTAAQP